MEKGKSFQMPKMHSRFKKKEKFDKKTAFNKKQKKSVLEANEIKKLQAAYDHIDPKKISTFKDFPLCRKTLQGLAECKYVTPTEIQRQSIGLSLQGKDILGAAKTGSGKTVAFLIPVLEGLNCLKWSRLDGLGALIISPTRELAYQTYEVLNKLGKHFSFSCGLVIGKTQNVKSEKKAIDNANIIVCTPGRLLQHMDETPLFNADKLQYLVLDEADRILDLGFTKEMDAIIENLPQERQTLLFSATQTREVKALLMRLGLTKPMLVSVHEHSRHITPDQLSQSYIVCEQHEKIDVVWSFIKTHTKCKMIVFLATCKQVRYIYETFCSLRPGVSVLQLHSRMKQTKRMQMYDQFNHKEFCVLFTTDVGARGLDFVNVQWVVQLDCPDSTETYTHRVGRTARMDADGESLLVLRPSEEEAMVEQLKKAKVPIDKLRVNPKKMGSIENKLRSQCAARVEMKAYAQAGFKSYLRSVTFMKNKAVFDITSLDTDRYASSLGLAVCPRVQWLEKKRQEKAAAEKKKKKQESDSEEEESDSGEEETGSEGEETDCAEEKNALAMDDDDDDDDDLLTVKSRGSIPMEDKEEPEPLPLPAPDSSRGKQGKKTKAALAKKILHKNIKVNSKIEFDEEGKPIRDALKQVAEKEDDKEEEEETGGIQLDKAFNRMREQDKIDKALFREKIKQRHREERLKEKEKRGKRKRDQEEAKVAVESGSEEDDGPDLSYLPDPDKIYGPKGSDDESDEQGDDSEDEDEEDSDESEEEEESEEDEEPVRKKAKRPSTEMTFGNLEDDEALALRLLNA